VHRLSVVLLSAYLGRPTCMSEGLKFYTWTFFFSFFLFLSIHRAKQPCSGWPSDVFRRFGRR